LTRRGFPTRRLTRNAHQVAIGPRYPPTVVETRLSDWSSELCPRLCPNGCQPSTSTVTYRETPKDMFRVPKSLKGLQKVCFGVSRGGSNASLSKRAPSTTRTSLRLESITCSDAQVRSGTIVISPLISRDHLRPFQYSRRHSFAECAAAAVRYSDVIGRQSCNGVCGRRHGYHAANLADVRSESTMPPSASVASDREMQRCR
jgi:hypothetical protein